MTPLRVTAQLLPGGHLVLDQWRDNPRAMAGSPFDPDMSVIGCL